MTTSCRRAVLAAFLASPSIAFSADAVRWSFDGATAEGWSPAHRLSSFTVTGGLLQTTITGSDPYMIGPVVRFDSAAYPYVELRLRSAGSGGGEVFFSSSQSPGIIAGNSVPFVLEGTGAFERIHVYMPGNPRWPCRPRA